MRSCFEIDNDTKRPVFLFVEPEGAEYALPPGEKVAVSDNYLQAPVTIRLGNTPDGEVAVSIWPGDGDVQVEKNGVSLLELVEQTTKARSA